MKSISEEKRHRAEQKGKKAKSEEEAHEKFTENQILVAWDSYVKRLKKKGKKILASILETDLPTVNGTVLEIELPNETMKMDLEREQGFLMTHIKREIKNTHIELKITVNKEAAKKYAFTPREKYEKLKEKNPLVEKLKNTFDLDI